jgi:hypothetical protein
VGEIGQQGIGVSNLAASSHPAPHEQAAAPIVAAFFTEYIPGVKNDYELLEKASEGPLKLGLPDLQMETLIFGLHCLDRAVFAQYGAAYRAAFMDSALTTASDAFAAVLPDHLRDHFLDHFKDRYNSRQYEYGKMKLLPDSDEGVKDVLSYEFGKRICFDAGVYEPEVVLVMVEGASDILAMMMKFAKTL